jgi:hypothetical protein
MRHPVCCVRNSEELRTSIWPRDNPIHILKHVSFSLQRPAPNLLGRGCCTGTDGKTLIMIPFAHAQRRDGETQIGRHGRCAIRTSSLRILTPHTGWNRSLFTRLRRSSERATIHDPKTVRRCQVVTIHLDGLIPVEDEPGSVTTEAALCAAKICKLNHVTMHFLNADPWAVTATPSHAKYLSGFGNITKVLYYSGRQPCAAKYYPDVWRPSEWSSAGYRRRADGRQLIASSAASPFSRRQRPGELQSIAAPGDARRWHHLQNHAAGTDVQNPTRTTSMSVRHNGLLAGILSSTRPPLHGYRLLRLLTMDDRVALRAIRSAFRCPPCARHHNNEETVSEILKCSIHSGSVSGRRRGHKDRHLHRWSSNALEHFRQRGIRRCQDQRRTRRNHVQTIVFCGRKFVITSPRTSV